MNDKVENSAGCSGAEWAASAPEQFDASEAFATHIEPLMDEICERAKAHGIPVLMFAVPEIDADGLSTFHSQSHRPSAARTHGRFLAAEELMEGNMLGAIAYMGAQAHRPKPSN
jgi:hypothetical protein